MLWDNEASDVWLSQIEEPVQVLDETASNDVTDYADWSTFDCKPYSVSFSVLFEVFSFVIKVANIRSDQLSLFFFFCVCVSTAQEQSNMYPSHSYTSSAPSNYISPPQQGDIGGPHKNGDPNMQEHSMINFTTGTAGDTITIHTGTVLRKPSQSAPTLCLDLPPFFAKQS